jgi:hypothetical protein
MRQVYNTLGKMGWDESQYMGWDDV